MILLDISFPPDVGGVEWDGFRIMEWFHRLEAAKKIPVIIITGSEDMKYKDRAVTGGAVVRGGGQRASLKSGCRKSGLPFQYIFITCRPASGSERSSAW